MDEPTQSTLVNLELQILGNEALMTKIHQKHLGKISAIGNDVFTLALSIINNNERLLAKENTAYLD